MSKKKMNEVEIEFFGQTFLCKGYFSPEVPPTFYYKDGSGDPGSLPEFDLEEIEIVYKKNGKLNLCSVYDLISKIDEHVNKEIKRIIKNIVPDYKYSTIYGDLLTDIADLCADKMQEEYHE